MLNDRTGNNSLNLTFINTQETLKGIRNLKLQDIQNLSHFVIEEIVETIPTTTQQSIYPIYPTLTTPYKKNTPFPPTTIQSTVKPSVVPNYSRMDYQTYRPITKSRQLNKKNIKK